MRKALGLLLSLLVVVTLPGCPPSADEAPMSEAAGGAPAQAAASQATPQTTVYISLDTNGNVTVSEDSVGVRNKGQAPHIAWAVGDNMGDRAWIVGFGGGSPFNNDQVVFSSDPGRDRAPIDRNAAAGTYKYWVWVADGMGGWLSIDPKIVIIDDSGGSADTASNPR